MLEIPCNIIFVHVHIHPWPFNKEIVSLCYSSAVYKNHKYRELLLCHLNSLLFVLGAFVMSYNIVDAMKQAHIQTG